MRASKSRNWIEVARRMAEALTPESIHPAVRHWSQRRLAVARGPWVIACSGGADSVALLLLVWALWPERCRSLTVLHFDHRQRGAASRRDEQFCRSVARALGCKYRSGTWTDGHRGAGEAQLRKARQAFFQREMTRLGAGALWLGHNADDVAETVLMRLARGSGTGGLAAPRPVQLFARGTVHVRPLLGLRRETIREALASAGGAWREDSSNEGSRYLRNRIRSKVMPTWKAAVEDRDVVVGASLSRELLEEDDDALETWLDEVKAIKQGPILDLARLQGRPKALWRRAVRRWLSATGYRGDLSKRGFDGLLGAAMRGDATRQSLGNEAFAVIGEKRMRYVRNLAHRTRK